MNNIYLNLHPMFTSFEEIFSPPIVNKISLNKKIFNKIINHVY